MTKKEILEDLCLSLENSLTKKNGRAITVEIFSGKKMAGYHILDEEDIDMIDKDKMAWYLEISVDKEIVYRNFYSHINNVKTEYIEDFLIKKAIDEIFSRGLFCNKNPLSIKT
jgi:hypothetical protein